MCHKFFFHFIQPRPNISTRQTSFTPTKPNFKASFSDRQTDYYVLERIRRSLQATMLLLLD